MRKVAILLILLVILVSGCNKHIEPAQDAELYKEEWIGEDAGNLSVEEMILIEMGNVTWPEEPETAKLPIPAEFKEITRSLPELEYNNLDMKLAYDLQIDHDITFENCRLNLNNHTITFLPETKVKIISSTITNGPKSLDDNDRFMGKPATRKPMGLAVNTHDFVLENSVVENSKGHGIHLLDSRKAVIINNTFIDNKWAALRAERSFVKFVNNTLLGNGCENNKAYCSGDSAFFSTVTYTNAKGANLVSNYLDGDMIFVNAIKVNLNRNTLNKALFQFSTGAVSDNFIKRVVAVASEFLEVKDNFMESVPEVSSGYEGRDARLKSTFPNYVGKKWTEEYTKHKCTRYFPANEYCAMVFSREEAYLPL